MLVRREVAIARIGTNSGPEEERADKKTALTGAEAQAFQTRSVLVASLVTVQWLRPNSFKARVPFLFCV